MAKAAYIGVSTRKTLKFLDYIQSTGTQYIDTGVTVKTNLVSQLKFNVKEITGGCIYGSKPGSDTEDYRLFNYNGACYLDVPGGSSDSGNRVYGGSLAAGVDHEVEVGNFYVKNLVTNTNIVSGSAKSFSEQSNTMKMWEPSQSSGKLYYLKIYEGTTLVRDFVPCQNADGTIGLYDKVNSKFYPNAGTGTFTAGNVVEEIDLGIVDVARKIKKMYIGVLERRNSLKFLDYIESSGTQYIDTEVSAPNGFRFTGKVRFVQSSANAQGIIGSYDTASPYNRNFLVAAENFSSWLLGAYDYSYFSNLQTNTDYELDASTVSGDVYCTINGVQQPVNLTPTSSTRTSKSLYLFGLNVGSAVSLSYARFSDCKIYVDDILVRDFVPCQNTDGSIGLYDKVNSKFYANKGTGTFKAGSVVEEIGGTLVTVARKVKKAYIGIAGIARQFFGGGGKPVYYKQLTNLSTTRPSTGATTGNYALFTNDSATTSIASNAMSVDAYDTALTKLSAGYLLNTTGKSSSSIGEYGIFTGGTDGTDSEDDTIYSTQTIVYNSALTSTRLSALTYQGSNRGNIKGAKHAIFAGGQDGAYYRSAVHFINSLLSVSSATDLPIAMHSCVGNPAGDYTFIMGLAGTKTESKTVTVYDSALTRYIPTPLSTIHYTGASAATSNHCLFAGGSSSTSNSSTTRSNVVEAYDSDMTLTTITPLHTPKVQINKAGGSLGDNAMFIGGQNNSGVTNEVEIYDESLTMTLDTSLPIKGMNFINATVGDFLIVAGGGTSSYSTNNATAYAYQLQ